MAEVKEPDLALAGLALLVIFGLLIWYDHPVESARPFGPYIQHQDLQTTGYIYESWLWQDPFVFDSISRKQESNEKEELEAQCSHQLRKLPPLRDKR